jgi:DNA-binding beta-propeller fold protein YncE
MWGSRLPQLNGPYALDYPRGVAVDPSNGNVWVNDTRSGYIKEYSSNGTFISEFGGPGGAAGQFLYAIGIAVGPNGNIYVPDSANDRLQELTQSGHEVAGFPVPCGSGLGYGGYTGCTGVAVDAAGNIYAAAPGNSVVYVFNASGHQIGTIGSTAPGGKLADPWDVALSGTTLYVTEATGNRVSAFNVASPAGPYPYLGNWGKAGTANGDLNRPLGITVDASGDIYVVDYTNARIEVFKP